MHIVLRQRVNNDCDIDDYYEAMSMHPTKMLQELIRGFVCRPAFNDCPSFHLILEQKESDISISKYYHRINEIVDIFIHWYLI